MALFDNVTEGSYATPTSPGSEFSGRQSRGTGVAYRGAGVTGEPALFANTPVDVMNKRQFVCYWQEFIDNMDCSHVQNAAGEPGALWEMVQTTTATATFDLLTDSQNGVAELNVVETTADMGVQIQLWPAAITATGECIRPATQQIVTWAMAGKMLYPLTSDWFIGLAEDGGAASILTVGTGAIANDHYIGFHHLEDSLTVDLVQSGAGDDVTITPLQTLWTPEDSESPLLLRELGIRIENNNKMYWYLNGICIGKAEVGDVLADGTVEAFTHGMTPTVCLVNGDETQAAVAWIDYHTFQVTRVQAPTGDGDL